MGWGSGHPLSSLIQHPTQVKNKVFAKLVRSHVISPFPSDIIPYHCPPCQPHCSPNMPWCLSHSLCTFCSFCWEYTLPDHLGSLHKVLQVSGSMSSYAKGLGLFSLPFSLSPYPALFFLTYYLSAVFPIRSPCEVWTISISFILSTYLSIVVHGRCSINIWAIKE